MQSYVEGGASQMGTAWDEIGILPAPPGTSLGQMDAMSLFSEVSDALRLRPIGVVTPWAARVGDLEWEDIPHPDTNVMLWELTDAAINAVPEVTFGSPLPFVGIVTSRPMSVAETRKMWEGTAYAPYETQAVYRQDDAKDPPTALFLHWGERIDIAKLPKEVLLLGPRASAAAGSLVFAAQIPAQNSTTRAAPSSSFASVLARQAPLPPEPPPNPTPGPIPLGPVKEDKMNLGVPIAVGLGAAALGFLLWKRKR